MLIVAGDETLPVAAARAGDSDAWFALFRRYQLPLYGYVVELVHIINLNNLGEALIQLDTMKDLETGAGCQRRYAFK